MKSFLKFLAIFLSVLLLSAILAPLLYKILPFKFARIFNRLVMIFSLAAIFLFVKIRKDLFTRFGLEWRSDSLGFLQRGFWAGVVLLCLLTGVRHGLGIVSFRWPSENFFLLSVFAFQMLGTGFLIGVLEEFFFRGFVYRSLSERFRWPSAIAVIVTSLFYSALHFVSKNKPWIGPDPTFMDSLKLMMAPFMAFAKWPEIWPAFFGLFLFGWVLNDLAIRTKSLYASIGLHAGCVFFVKSDGRFVDYVQQTSLFYGSKMFYDGVMGWIFLLILFIALRIWIRTAQPQKG